MVAVGLMSMWTPLSHVPTASAASAQISITDTGFQPASVSVQPGESLTFTNQASGPQSVTSDEGLFDSGSIAPGGGFSMAIAVPGNHTYHSTVTPALTGVIQVASPAALLSGPATDPANSHIPNLVFPDPSLSDISNHPLFGLPVSRTRILVMFAPTATVAQANAALAAANVTVLGGLPELKILLVAAPDTPDLSGLAASLTSLRSNAAIQTAAMSPQISTTRMLPGPGGIPGPLPPNWNWNVVNGPNGEPFGDGGNWGLKASRFPQAWDLLDAIRRQPSPSAVETAVLDAGFLPRTDLPALKVETGNPAANYLCITDSTGTQKCVNNAPTDHGNEVAASSSGAIPPLE